MAASLETEDNFNVQLALSTVDNFLRKLKCDDWLSKISKEEMKECVHSAKLIENVLVTLETNNSLEDFVAMLPNHHGLSLDQPSSVCDAVLEMTLTAPGVPLSCVCTCIDEYCLLCGSQRFERMLSTVINHSEIYRVLLDYLASSDGDLEHLAVMMQSQLLLHIWQNEVDVQKLKDLMYRWLKADASGQNIAVALKIVNLEDEGNNVTYCLSCTLVTLLRERSEQAVFFWKMVLKVPHAIRVLEKDSELQDTALDFLKTSGQWMEATSNFSWKSRENGPCRALAFDELVRAMKLFLQADVTLSSKTKTFLSQRRNSEGCTLWDDIHGRLTIP